jgi:MFS transporter, DHA2 family, multidrug resistance protein
MSLAASISDSAFAAPARRATNMWLIAALVALAAFMEVLDTTIVNVALPHIAGNMAATVDESTWVLTSYLVANAIVLPLNGFLSALFGRKRYFMGCMALFTISSLLCGLAPNFEMLIFFRVLQGLGGGGLQPGAQAILRDTIPLEKIGTAMAIYGIVAVVGPVLGPLLGGWITDNFSWRWCFLINIPVGIITLYMLLVLLHDPPHQRRIKLQETGFDYMGLSFLVLGVACLQIMLDKGQDDDWFGSKLIFILAVLAGLGLVCFIIWEWYEQHPIVDLRMLENRNFGLATLGMFMFGGVLYASTTLLPLMMQTLMGYDARLAGQVLAPGGLVVLFFMPLVGFLVPRAPTRWLVIFGIAINVLALVMMSRLDLLANYGDLVLCRSVQGLGLAFLFVPFNTAAFGFVPPARISDASGIINLARNIGGSFGIALANAYVRQLTQVHQTYLVGNISPLNPAYHQSINAMTGALARSGASASSAHSTAQALIYNLVQNQAGMQAYVDAFRVMAVLFFMVIPVALLLRTPPFKKRPIVAD